MITSLTVNPNSNDSFKNSKPVKAIPLTSDTQEAIPAEGVSAKISPIPSTPEVHRALSVMAGSAGSCRASVCGCRVSPRT